MIRITDDFGVMRASDKLNLIEAAKSWSFDVDVLINSNQVADNGNQLVIEINSVANEVSVYFGDNMNVPKSAWRNVTSAGNSDFSKGALSSGIEKIVAEAHRSKVSSEVIQKENFDVGSPYRNGALGVCLLIFLVFGVQAVLRDRKRRSVIRNDP